jgi:acyl-CoA oxidase
MATLARAVRGLARPAHSRLCTCALPQRQALSTLSPRTHSTAAAAAIDEEAEWAAAFKDATDAFSGEDSHETSAQRMRELVKSGLLRHTDLRDRPDRFFEAHRLLARRAVSEGPGFWIRFTVHYNLCYGTVLAVGNENQIAALDNVEAAGMLGCFALTEKRAGVQSGLVVETTATYDNGEFVLNSPNQGAFKNWISQGHVADQAVVLADLTVGSERVGPHAFLVDMASAGISTGDMGVKTTGNDLDNAWIGFNGVRVPRSALLDAHCDVSADGTYARTTEGILPFEMIGQRLYTGRVAVAQAALAFRRQVYEVTEAYAKQKPIPDVAGRKGRVLADIPQLRALFADAAKRADALEAFVGTCEDRLAPLLKTGAVPDADLALAIATAKVRAVEDSIDACWQLKQEVGSYALMGDSGFKHLDFLNCCKFAEGDSRVLAQKMARDYMRVFAKKGDDGTAASRLAADLAKALAPAAGDKVATAELWDENFEKIYALADAVMDRVVAEA